MSKAVYPGSFDPITYGHIDIIERASKIFDNLIVGVLNNSSKTPLFTANERVKMIKNVIKHLPNVTVLSFNGLLIDFAHQNNANVIVRGLRAVTDFEYELQLSLTNKVIAPDIETIFLTTNQKYSYLSSNIVKEIARLDGDISSFVNENVEKIIKNKMLHISQE